MSKLINRRSFVSTTALSGLGVLLSGRVLGSGSSAEEISLAGQGVAGSRYDIMRDMQKYRKIDAHIHVDLASSNAEVQKKYADTLLDFCDRMKVDRLVLSKPVTLRIDGQPDTKPESFIDHNNVVLGVMKQHPGQFMGSFTFNPVYQKEALEEIKRCVDQGMIGAKLYYQVKINDPSYYPLIEKMIDLKMIIHMHAEVQLGVGGYRMKYNGNKATNTSIPEDFVDIAKRYPEAMFQFAHIGGGGDWEYMCKALKNSPNVYVDVSGSNNEENLIDFAVKELGEDRLFFGSDNCYHQAIGKVLASRLTESQKKKVFFENFNNILRKAGNHVD